LPVEAGIHARRLRCLIGLVLLFATAAVVASVATAAGPGSRSPSKQTLHLRFAQVAPGFLTGISEDRHVLIAPAPQTAALPEVIDDASHRVFTVPVSGPVCVPLGISVTDVFFSCGSRWQPDVRVYRFTDGTPQPVLQFNSGCQDDDPTCGAQPAGVGANWIEYQINPCYHCDGYSGPAFQNRHSGKVVEHKLGGRTFANLDAPRVLQTVCRPLRAPSGGSLIPIGRFALATSSRGTALEKCGSRRPLLTIRGVVPFRPAQRRAIVWPGTKLPVTGIELPSLKRFAIALPKGILANGRTVTAVLITSRTLYLQIQDQKSLHPEVWAAPAPRL
jgi:hypothetical protein